MHGRLDIAHGRRSEPDWCSSRLVSGEHLSDLGDLTAGRSSYTVAGEWADLPETIGLAMRASIRPTPDLFRIARTFPSTSTTRTGRKTLHHVSDSRSAISGERKCRPTVANQDDHGARPCAGANSDTRIRSEFGARVAPNPGVPSEGVRWVDSRFRSISTDSRESEGGLLMRPFTPSGWTGAAASVFDGLRPRSPSCRRSTPG